MGRKVVHLDYTSQFNQSTLLLTFSFIYTSTQDASILPHKRCSSLESLKAAELDDL